MLFVIIVQQPKHEAKNNNNKTCVFEHLSQLFDSHNLFFTTELQNSDYSVTPLSTAFNTGTNAAQ